MLSPCRSCLQPQPTTRSMQAAQHSPPTSPPAPSSSSRVVYSPGRLPPSPTAVRVSAGRVVPTTLDLVHPASQPIPGPSRVPDSPPMSSERAKLSQSSHRPLRLESFKSSPPVTPDRPHAHTPAKQQPDSADRSNAWMHPASADHSFESTRSGASGGSSAGRGSRVGVLGLISPRSLSSGQQHLGGKQQQKSARSPSSPQHANQHPTATSNGLLLHPRRGSSPLGRMPANVSRLSLASAAGPSHHQQDNHNARTSASRFLITVVPPLHLPHDPPHPRTPQACSGYGPPSQFR